MNYGFIIDNRKCIGCHACTVACKSEHEVPLGVNRTWVKYIERGEFPHAERLFSVMRCNHCAEAPCVEICPVTALFTAENGIVDFDNRRCIGCKACMQACPYDALYIDPETHTAAKCNYCAHREATGLEPACVNVCPTHAIISGDLDNPKSEIARLKVEQRTTARMVEKGTEPNLWYIEGDRASLDPGAAEQDGEYMWGGQVSGVGHFAKFSEARMAAADPETMAKQLAGSIAQVGELVSFGDADTDILVPRGRDAAEGARMRAAAEQVAKERSAARRTYDAPSKGALWGWEVTAYMWTKAIAAGAFLVPACVSLLALAGDGSGFGAPPAVAQWVGWWAAMGMLGATGALLVYDLDQPKRFLYVMLRPQWGSWLVRGAYIIGAYVAVLCLWALTARGGGSAPPAITGAGAALAVMTAIYTAFLFKQARGRDFWQSPMLILHMLAHALIAGAAAHLIALPVIGALADPGSMFVMFRQADAWAASVRWFLVFGIALHAVADGIELFGPHASEDARRTARMITHGRFARLFWGGVFLCGSVAPLALATSIGGTGALAAAGVLALGGVWLAEHIWVRAPQLLPLS